MIGPGLGNTDPAFSHTLPRRSSGTPDGLVGRIRSAIGASVWITLVGRGALVVVGLLVLAWIGRATTSARASQPSTTTDGGASPAVVAASAVAPALPQPAPPDPMPVAIAPAALPSAVATATATARATAEDPVYINHASAEQLRRLPGVGPKRADAIVALRQRMGHFQRIEDLLRVKGIGRTTLRRWRPLVRLDAPDGGAP